MKVELLDHMGNDNSIVDAARVSFSKSHEQYSDEVNKSLITYLATGQTNKDRKNLLRDMLNVNNFNKAREIYNAIRNIKTHWTPFAHTAITLRVSAPVPIRTQCFKHKQGLVENEESRRYITYEPEVFTPVFRKASSSLKQGSLDEVHPDNEHLQEEYWYAVDIALDTYTSLLEQGVPPEQARFVLPQGTMVNWIWTGNLYAFANFYVSRTAPEAQKEIRQLAELVGEAIKPLFPISWKVLTRTLEGEIE